jgi:hypothetical protein
VKRAALERVPEPLAAASVLPAPEELAERRQATA